MTSVVSVAGQHRRVLWAICLVVIARWLPCWQHHLARTITAERRWSFGHLSLWRGMLDHHLGSTCVDFFEETTPSSQKEIVDFHHVELAGLSAWSTERIVALLLNLWNIWCRRCRRRCQARRLRCRCGGHRCFRSCARLRLLVWHLRFSHLNVDCCGHHFSSSRVPFHNLVLLANRRLSRRRLREANACTRRAGMALMRSPTSPKLGYWRAML